VLEPLAVAMMSLALAKHVRSSWLIKNWPFGTSAIDFFSIHKDTRLSTLSHAYFQHFFK